ncbi:MAG: hypothetical protein E7455_00715 [Ruminococcaceae bacterium]|nr:hypothetical protein [Oscillospiraceae bacterium]
MHNSIIAFLRGKVNQDFIEKICRKYQVLLDIIRVQTMGEIHCSGMNIQKIGRIINITVFYEKILVYSQIICYYSLRRRSILVGIAIFQEGPKNPLKGTSMKSLVSAFYAQFRVDAGG